jgi:signal transduction histidine kinase
MSGQPPVNPLQRVSTWGTRAAASLRRYPLAVDAALVILLALIAIPRHGNQEGGDQSGWTWVLFAVALVVPLVWRRKAPTIVFTIISAVALVQWASHQLSAADVALLVAFYTVAAYEPRRNILAAAAVLEFGAVLAAARFAPPGTGLWVWILISGMITAAGVIGYNIRTRRAYFAALEDRAIRAEHDRDQQAKLAAAAERARIAREMHDVVAHNIAVMIALADGAAYTTASNPAQATAIMGQVSGTGRSALAEMRRLLGVMRDTGQDADHAPQPTIADLDELLTAVRSAGLAARLVFTGQPFPLPPSAQLAVYRIVQEALTNTLKHARATTTDVRLRYLGEAVDLEIVDNGHGPDNGLPDGVVGGHGITGMRERAAVFGGDILAGPRPGGGWQVHTTLHITPATVEAGAV